MNLFMIMGHKNAKQIIRMAKWLKTTESDVIIHCDSYMDDYEYKLLLNFSYQSGVYITKKRLRTMS